MAYEPTVWRNREVEKPRTYTLQNNVDGTVTLNPAEGTIVESGTPLVAENLNKIEQGIEDAHNTFGSYLPLTGGTMTGNITFEDTSLRMIKFYDGRIYYGSGHGDSGFALIGNANAFQIYDYQKGGSYPIYWNRNDRYWDFNDKINMKGGTDITFQAKSGSSDPGDLIYRDGSANEMARIYMSGTSLFARNQATGTTYTVKLA